MYVYIYIYIYVYVYVCVYVRVYVYMCICVYVLTGRAIFGSGAAHGSPPDSFASVCTDAVVDGKSDKLLRHRVIGASERDNQRNRHG